MVVLMEVISRRSNEFQEKVDTANTAMSNINLPDPLQAKVRDYFLFTQPTLEQQQELNKFMALLSPNLIQNIQQHIFKDVLARNEIVQVIVDRLNED